MRRLLIFILFSLSFGLGLYFNHLNRVRESFRTICDLTEEHFYRDDDRLKQWVRECHRRAALISAFSSVPQLMGDIQDLMNEMAISHFQVYNPVEDRRLWKGESIDTGIRSRYVEEHLVVYQVLAKSAGESAGVKAGDEILAIAGAEQVTPWGAQHRSGRFWLRRGSRDFPVDLQSRNLVMDNSPHLQKVDGKTALVELSSFRSEFFDGDAWRGFSRQFKSYSHLILDLRDNAGGNFVAMLRALSTFQCAGKKIGVLLQPRKKALIKPGFDDNTSDDYQIRELDQFGSLDLVTFADYGCYQGKVTVLIGPETSSVAEIFANSFLWRKDSRVWGQPTAGDVVLAVWYDLPALGPGFSFSVPEAVYLTPGEKQLEGHGVVPQKELHYDLKLSLAGKDSWVIEASR